MNKRLTVIVDADAIIALANQNDKHHNSARSISFKLAEMNAHVLYPSTAVAESNAFIQRPLNNNASAYGIAELFTNPEINIAEVNQQTLKTAKKYFSPRTSKKNTFFDCIVAAIAYEQKAEAIFSFDKFYKRKGFKLASEIVK